MELTPSMGVTLSVDGAPSRSVATGDSIALDARAHMLSFGCPVCLPVRRDVAPGDKDDRIAVRLAIRPATLVIHGDVSKTYQLVEHPEISVSAGANNVALGSEFDRVTVRQIETGAAVQVRLHAGSSIEVAFDGTP